MRDFDPGLTVDQSRTIFQYTFPNFWNGMVVHTTEFQKALTPI